MAANFTYAIICQLAAIMQILYAEICNFKITKQFINLANKALYGF